MPKMLLSLSKSSKFSALAAKFVKASFAHFARLLHLCNCITMKKGRLLPL